MDSLPSSRGALGCLSIVGDTVEGGKLVEGDRGLSDSTPGATLTASVGLPVGLLVSLSVRPIVGSSVGVPVIGLFVGLLLVGAAVLGLAEGTKEGSLGEGAAVGETGSGFRSSPLLSTTIPYSHPHGS